MIKTIKLTKHLICAKECAKDSYIFANLIFKWCCKIFLLSLMQTRGSARSRSTHMTSLLLHHSKGHPSKGHKLGSGVCYLCLYFFKHNRRHGVIRLPATVTDRTGRLCSLENTSNSFIKIFWKNTCQRFSGLGTKENDFNIMDNSSAQYYLQINELD